MAAHVLPLLTSCDLHFTLGERRAAAAWCAFRGPAWSIRITQSTTGYTVLNIVTPGRVAPHDDWAAAWLVRKMPAGLLLIDVASDRAVGIYPSISDVLVAVTKVEGAEATNDNQPNLSAAYGMALNHPRVGGGGSKRRTRSGSSQ